MVMPLKKNRLTTLFKKISIQSQLFIKNLKLTNTDLHQIEIDNYSKQNSLFILLNKMTYLLKTIFKSELKIINSLPVKLSMVSS